MPFPTGLQAAYRHGELAIIIYGGSQIACGLSLLTLWIYATRKQLVGPHTSPAIITSMSRRLALSPVISLVAIGVSLLSRLKPVLKRDDPSTASH